MMFFFELNFCNFSKKIIIDIDQIACYNRSFQKNKILYLFNLNQLGYMINIICT